MHSEFDHLLMQGKKALLKNIGLSGKPLIV